MKIGNEIIGKNTPAHLIAEIGINHNGSVKKAIELMKTAKLCGANSVKLQYFSPDSFLSKNSKYLSTFQKVNLEYSDVKTLFDYAKSESIELFSSVFDFKKIEELEKLDCPAYKVASGDLTHFPMLKMLSKLNKPIIISNGGSTLLECERSINCIKEVNENIEIALLHCVSKYPADISELNLANIKFLKNKFNSIVGFSDHTIGSNAAIIASALGAEIIEKHFTLDKNLEGPDHALSANPEELTKISQGINHAFKCLGEPVLEPVELKQNIIEIRRSIVANCRISKGDIITKDMLAFKRPGNGLSPEFLDKVVGKVSLKDFQVDEKIDLEFL